MAQPLPVVPLDHGRRISGLALASAILALVVFGFDGAALGLLLILRLAPEGVAGRWFLAMLSVGLLAELATVFLGPLAIGLGLAGLWTGRNRRDADGRGLAWLGIALVLGACLLLVAGGNVLLQWSRSFRSPGAATPAATVLEMPHRPSMEWLSHG